MNKDRDKWHAQADANALNPPPGANFTTWNVSTTVAPGYYLLGTVPDTFTYHFNFTSDKEVEWAILSFDQLRQLNQCPNDGRSWTDSVTGAIWTHAAGCLWQIAGPFSDHLLSGTSAAFDFHLAEGCADYVSIIIPLFAGGGVVTITPNVSVTFQPADHATGVCA